MVYSPGPHPRATEEFLDMADLNLKDRVTEIQRATPREVSQLACLCRRSFPESLRWQGLSCVARAWWNSVVSLDTGETYVLRSEDQIVAFCLLVVDEVAWKEQTRRRTSPIWLRLSSALLCPRVVIRALNRKRREVGGRSADGTCCIRPAAGNLADRVWIELIAVSPEQRGKGHAVRLLRKCEARAGALKKSGLGLRVDEDNRAARALYEKAGYVEVACRLGHCYYAKSLNPDTAQGLPVSSA